MERPTSRLPGRRVRTGELDPNSVRVLDEGEESPSFGEGGTACRRTPRKQFSIRAFHVLAFEREVIQLVAAAIGAGEERGAFWIPVEFQDPS